METLKDNFNNLVLKTLEMDQIETKRIFDNITGSTNVRKQKRSRESAGPDRKKTKFLKE